MRQGLISLILLFCLVNCGDSAPTGPKVGQRVSDPDHLYFKNIRIRAYQVAEDEASYRTHYLHKGFRKDTLDLQLVLVDNWIQSRAFLALGHSIQRTQTDQSGDASQQATAGVVTPNANGISGSSGKIIFLRYEEDKPEIIFTSDGLNDAAALAKLKQMLSANSRICYQIDADKQEHCLPVGGPSRQAIQETIRDYLALTQLDRT